MAVISALVIPLLFAGNAGARFMGDGATPDGLGGWQHGTDFVCVVGVNLDGTLVVDTSVTDRKTCQYYNTGLTSMNPVDVTASSICGAAGTLPCNVAANCTGTSFLTKGSLTFVTGPNKCYDSAPCTVAGFAGGAIGGVTFPANTGGKHATTTSICTDGAGNFVSLHGLDRTAQMCQAKGSTWLQTSATAPVGVSGTFPSPNFGGLCVANGAFFKGQDATGAPFPFGATGTSGADMGYCYTTVRMATATAKNGTSINYSTAAGCPSSGATTAPFNADAAYDWSTAASPAICNYSKASAGILQSNLTKVDGTANGAAGTFKDLSVYTTSGECIANGGSWANWFGKPPAFDSYTTSLGTAKLPAWDYTKQAPDADDGCLHCHSSKIDYNGPYERAKDSYLKTGHKNMLRKVTAGQPWGGADGVNYTAYAAGTIDFGTLGGNNATATVSGVPKPLLYLFGDWMAPAPAGLDVVVDMGGTTGARYNGTSAYSCAACHSTGWNNLDLGTDGNPVGLCSLSSKTTQTLCTGAGGTWFPFIGVKGIGNIGFNPAEPHASFPAVTFNGVGNWDVEGIQCGRCHNAAVGPVTAAMIAASQYPTTHVTSGGMGSIDSGPAAFTYSTGLCFGCHQSIAKTSNGLGADANLTSAVSIPTKNNITTGTCSDPTKTSESTCNLAGAIWTPTGGVYQPEFNSHVIGGSFLNSVHARYTGAIQPNSMGKYDLSSGGTYSSAFQGFTCWQSSSSNSPAKTYIVAGETHEIKDKATCETLYGAGAWRTDTRGGCSSCHDVHQSLFVAGQEALRKECTSCHENATYKAAVPVTPQVELAVMKHPTGFGTPASYGEAACEVCHMPKATAAGFPMHLWRINTDPAYRTFPTAAQYGVGVLPTQKVANTAPDGAYANAVWVDIDLACGQCHGGGPNEAGRVFPPKDNGGLPIPYISKNDLQWVAKDIHLVAAANTAPTALGLSGRTTTYLTVQFTDASTDAQTATPNLQVTVDWGDGNTANTGIGGAPYSHTYASAGTYTILHTVKDAGGLSGSESLKVTVPQTQTISGHVYGTNGSTGIENAMVYLKVNGSTKQQFKTTVGGGGAYSFTANAGSYQVQAYKSGMTFDATPLTSSIDNPILVDATLVDVTQDFTQVLATVQVNVTPALTGVKVYLRQGGVTTQSCTTNASGQCSMAGVNPGAYQAQASLSGYVFSPNPQSVTVLSTGATVPFTRTP